MVYIQKIYEEHKRLPETISFDHDLDVEHYRFRNNNDIVPTVPLWIMGYRHHGTERYINHYGNIRRLSFWQKIKDSLRGRWCAMKNKQIFDGIYDHNIEHYSSKLKKFKK